MTDEDKDDRGLERIPVIIGFGLDAQERLLEGQESEAEVKFEEIMLLILRRVQFSLKEMGKTEIECMEHLFKSMTESPENLQQEILTINQMVVKASEEREAELEKLTVKIRKNLDEIDSTRSVIKFIEFSNTVKPTEVERGLERQKMILKAWNTLNEYYEADRQKVRYPLSMGEGRNKETVIKEATTLKKIAEDLEKDFDNHPKSKDVRDKWSKEDQDYKKSLINWEKQNKLPDISALPESVTKLVPGGDIREAVFADVLPLSDIRVVRENLSKLMERMRSEKNEILKEKEREAGVEPPYKYYPWLPIAVD